MRQRVVQRLLGLVAICSGPICLSVGLADTPKPIELGRPSLAQAEEPLIQTPDAHGRDPLAANSAWFREFKRDVSADPVDPKSDEMLARLRNAKGTIRGDWSVAQTPPGPHWYTFPFQVVRGDTPVLKVPGRWSYSSASNGPYMLPPEPVIIENSGTTKYATRRWTDGEDHHLCIYVRDEATGGYKELWEYYQPWITRTGKEITRIAGASWRKFDLLNGEVPPPGTPATDAAGMMITPLLVRYDEVARGEINHALRFCVNGEDISPTFKWPARTAAAAPNRETGMPYGTRLRIKASWWSANADVVLGVKTHARVIAEAIRRYGIILADRSNGSTIQLQGVADTRWEEDTTQRLRAIHVAALEVVATPPLLEISGPKELEVGQSGTWTMTLLPAESPVGAGSNVNLYDRNDKVIRNAWATIDEAHRMVTVQHRFDEPGVYVIRCGEPWNLGFGPYYIRVDRPVSPTKWPVHRP